MLLCRKDKSKGAALVVALLITALVTILAVEISWRFNLAASRNGNRWFGMQARAYLEAVEDFARVVLTLDMEEGEVDNLSEIWAQEQPPFPTDEGYVGGRIEDAQGRLNLNLLQEKVEKPKNGGIPTEWSKRYTASQRRFIRLLQTVEFEEIGVLDQSQAEAITEALIDWIDADSEVSGFGGAEGDHYSRLEPPITIPNREMISVSELSLVNGMFPQLYEAILPYIIALPADVGMNINTMPLNLMRCLNSRNDPQPLSLDDAQVLIEARGMEGFDTVEDFKSAPEVEALMGSLNSSSGSNSGSNNRQGGRGGKGGAANDTGLDISNLGVASDYFLFFWRSHGGRPHST